jgi:hypothetical protein
MAGLQRFLWRGLIFLIFFKKNNIEFFDLSAGANPPENPE